MSNAPIVEEVQSAKGEDSNIAKAASQKGPKKRPKLVSKSYKALHKPKQEADDAVVAADVLDLPTDVAQKRESAVQSLLDMAYEVETSIPPAPRPAPLRRSTVPGAAPAPAVPGASGLRSRAAWKKALEAAQNARAAQDAMTPPPKGSSERQESSTALKTSKPRETSKGCAQNHAEKSDHEARRATEEAEIAQELSKLQLLQEQQEKKLQRFLGDAKPCLSSNDSRLNQRRSSAPDMGERPSNKLEMARDAAKTARLVQDAKQRAAPSSPLRNLRQVHFSDRQDECHIGLMIFRSINISMSRALCGRCVKNLIPSSKETGLNGSYMKLL